MTVISAPPRADSIVATVYDAPDYLDRFVATVAPDAFADVDAVVDRWFLDQPGWLRVLSTNTLSRRKVVESLPPSGYRIGNSVGSWDVVDRSAEEIVFGDDMGFMQYRFSFRRVDTRHIEAATAVRYLWPRTGRFYFSIVRRFHRRFVAYALARTASGPGSTGPGSTG
jgi:hypothetical protein